MKMLKEKPKSKTSYKRGLILTLNCYKVVLVVFLYLIIKSLCQELEHQRELQRQKELARQREFQLQKELARQRKLQRQKELARLLSFSLVSCKTVLFVTIENIYFSLDI